MTPAPLRILVVLLSALCGLIGLFSLWMGTLHLSSQVGEFTFSPAVVGFELLGMAAVAIGIVGALKNRWKAAGLAAACVAGTFASVAVLSFLELRENAAASLQQPLRALLVARVGAGLGIAAAGVLAVLLRRPRSFVDLIYAAAFLLIPAVIGGLTVTRGFTWLGVVPGEQPSPIAVTAITIGTLVILVCLSGAVHLVVRAFERGTCPVMPGDVPGAEPGAEPGPQA